MKSMREVIKNIMEKISLSDGYKKNWLLERWNDLAGDAASHHSTPTKISRSLLFVRVDSSVWTYHMFTQKNTIINKINQLYGSDMILDIKFQSGKIENEIMEKESEIIEKLIEQSLARRNNSLDKRILQCIVKRIEDKK